MDTNGLTFLDKVLALVKEERNENLPLVEFKSPKELESILARELDVRAGADEGELERCVRAVLRHSVRTHQPAFRNQLYGGTDPYGLAGAWLAEACNTSQYTYEVAPAFTLIELAVLQHILALFGVPGGDGIFSPGGSVSMLYALVAARFHAFPDAKTKGMRALPDLALFTSVDSHYSIMKAAHWLGLGTESVVAVPVDEEGRMRVCALEEALGRAAREGRVPLLVNATAGTTVLGAIDDLEAVAAACRAHNVWMHVDACWGGTLILSQKYRGKLKGIEKADSVSWNPHKMAGAPLQCSVFVTRRRGLLQRANAASAQYLFQQDKFYDVRYDTGDKSVQCGRKIDAFKLWVMWKARGDGGLGAQAERVLELAQWGAQQAAARPGFRLLLRRLQCPNICFWYIPTFMRGLPEDEHWWDRMHKITPKIKELLVRSSRLMVAYCPLRQYKNFFRLALTFHPALDEQQLLDMFQAIQDCGEQITEDML